MTTHGPDHEKPQFEPYKQPLGKISMWFGIATTPLLATSVLVITSAGDSQIIVAGVLHFFVFVFAGTVGLLSLILGGLAFYTKHQENYASIGMWLTALSALVGFGSFFVH